VVEFLSGAVTLGFAIAGVCFLKFWRKTGDRLFVHFAIAFWLFACNQLLVVVIGGQDERVAYVYLLRVLGFVLILSAIVGKNTVRGQRG
jgi:hypothetical protein